MENSLNNSKSPFICCITHYTLYNIRIINLLISNLITQFLTKLLLSIKDMLSCLIAFLCLTTHFTDATQAWMNKGDSPETRAKLLLSEMTLEEKLDMLHGIPNSYNGDVIYVGLVKGNERLGIPELRLNDG